MRLRSLLFVPANQTRFIEKAIRSDADAIILDVEDSVPYNEREIARKNIINYVNDGRFIGRQVFIRINPVEEMDFIYDICELVINGITGMMPAKINTDEDVVFLSRLLSFFEKKNHIQPGAIKLAPLIETALAVENVTSISRASDRIVALCLGAEDYLNDIKSICTYQESALVYPRAKIVNAARARGVQPIDTPYVDYADLVGFERAAKQSYSNGFAGSLLITPRQIEIANEYYSPTEQQVCEAEDIMKAYALSKEKSIISINGRIIGPPMKKKAINVMQQVSVLEVGDDPNKL